MTRIRNAIYGLPVWNWLVGVMGLNDDLRRMAARDEHLLARVVRMENWLNNIDEVVFRLEHGATGVEQHKADAAKAAGDIRSQISRSKAEFPSNLEGLIDDPGSTAKKRPE